MATKRLRKEFASLLKDPVPNIVAVPLPANILEWHYIIFGLGHKLACYLYLIARAF